MNLSHIFFFFLGYLVTSSAAWIYTKYKNGKPKQVRFKENIGADAPRVFLRCSIKSYVVESGGVVLHLYVEDEVISVKTTNEVMHMFPVDSDVVLQLQKSEQVRR